MNIIGNSGHAFVAIGILEASGFQPTGYCDFEEKKYNPFSLEYLGSETDVLVQEKLRLMPYFIGIGDNAIRKKVQQLLENALGQEPVNAIHPKAMISVYAGIASGGVMVSAGACINPFSSIGKGAICNTGAIIEHECKVGAYAHIGPGAILCGNVTIGEGSFIGAGAVIKQGVTIGKQVMIGAGAVVLHDLPDNQTVVGNPSRLLK